MEPERIDDDDFAVLHGGYSVRAMAGPG
jgi:hypothetical protein